MATYTKYQPFIEDVMEKVHNLGSDALKVVLSNTAQTNTWQLLSSVTQIANGNGYTTGGSATSQTSSAQTAGTYKLVLSDVVFTASGGSMATLRYAVLYNDTPTSPLDPLIASWDYGSGVTLATGESFTVDFDATNGVIQAS